MPTEASSGSETLVVQADNQVTSNPDFAATGTWVAGAGWSISGTANASSASSDLEQTLSPAPVQDDYYLVGFTVTSYTSGTVTPKIGGTAGLAISETGRHTQIIKSGAGTLVEFTAASATLSIDDVLVVEIGQLLYSTTTAGTYQLALDLSNMTYDDEVMAMVGFKVRSADDLQWMQVGSWAHPQTQSAAKVSVPVASVHEFAATVVQTAGTAISVPWSVIDL